MKILVNAITCKMGGSKEILNSFISNIEETDGNEYYFLVYEKAINEDIKAKLGRNIYIEESYTGDYNVVKKFLWYQFVLPKFIRKKKYDVFFNLSNYGPALPGCRQVLLLHNSKHVSLEMRKNFNTIEKISLFLHDFILMISLLGTSKLIVQTNYMKNRVIQKFGIKEELISVIPNCPGEEKTDSIDTVLEEKLTAFIQDEKNVLSCITLYGKHKNLELLIHTVKLLKEQKNVKFKLIITIDDKECKEAASLLSSIEKNDLGDCILSVGNVKHENIHQILNKTRIFVFPSYAESFGMPYIEAMKSGLPIIAADLGFAHDVCGETALYFRYDDKEALADRIITLLGNDEIYKNTKHASETRSGMFSGFKTAKEYMRILSEQ